MKGTKLDVMVEGYMDGLDWTASNSVPIWIDKKPLAYQHGFMNGMDDRRGNPRERADVLRRRASMILGDAQ